MKLALLSLVCMLVALVESAPSGKVEVKVRSQGASKFETFVNIFRDCPNTDGKCKCKWRPFGRKECERKLKSGGGGGKVLSAQPDDDQHSPTEDLPAQPDGEARSVDEPSKEPSSAPVIAPEEPYEPPAEDQPAGPGYEEEQIG